MRTDSFNSPYIKKRSRKEPKQDRHIQTLQMYRVLASSVKAMSRSLRENDYGSLIQAGHNVRIVEEIYEQLPPEEMGEEENSSLLRLGRNLATISDLLIKAKTEDPIFKNVANRLPPYFDLLLEDLCESKKQIYFPKTDKKASLKLLPAIKEDIVLIMATSSSKKTITSGIYLHQIVENMANAFYESRHLLNFKLK